MLSLLRHPNIVLLMGVCTKPPNLIIATEYITGGSLYQILHKTKYNILLTQHSTIRSMEVQYSLADCTDNIIYACVWSCPQRY